MGARTHHPLNSVPCSQRRPRPYLGRRLPFDRGRWSPALVAIVGVSAFLFVFQVVYYASGAVPIIMVDWDRGHYMDASQRFLDIGTPYLPWEVAGAVRLHATDVPPPAARACG